MKFQIDIPDHIVARIQDVAMSLSGKELSETDLVDFIMEDILIVYECAFDDWHLEDALNEFIITRSGL